jgi:predicted transcriptional regulator
VVARHRSSDGTPVFHPIGKLLIDLDDQRMCCGLCGRWFLALGGHLSRAHDWSADDYRAAFGLNAQRPLQAPAVSAAQANSLRRRLETERAFSLGCARDSHWPAAGG